MRLKVRILILILIGQRNIGTIQPYIICGWTRSVIRVPYIWNKEEGSCFKWQESEGILLLCWRVILWSWPVPNKAHAGIIVTLHSLLSLLFSVCIFHYQELIVIQVFKKHLLGYDAFLFFWMMFSEISTLITVILPIQQFCREILKAYSVEWTAPWQKFETGKLWKNRTLLRDRFFFVTGLIHV